MKEFKGFMHGINLGGWLSQCDHTKERYENFIREEDIARIKGWGLDHIRVPVDYDLVEDTEGNYKEEGFSYIQRAIDWCQKYGLNMVLDLHKTFGYSFDAGEQESGFFDVPAYQERFYRLWEQFAGRFGKYDGMLAFELLNEVTDEAYSDKWNEISSICIAKIHCGEFGVIDRADPQDALKWYREILRCFDEKGIGRAAWSYKEMDFGFVDEHFAPVAEKVIQLL